jgi:hypothetical protein
VTHRAALDRRALPAPALRIVSISLKTAAQRPTSGTQPSARNDVTEPIHTSISVVQRTITQLLANGRTVRYTLAPASDGDVYWRQDTFAPADHPIQPLRWLSHQGPLTVAAVVAAVPQCREAIRAWTQAEVDDALAATDLDETARRRRAAAVTRLREQLDAPQDDSRAA